ncbi:hypothetical protein [Psychrobacillus sp. BM2]|uniref:hypothetical protein n=1 Tax=Psychrobacillus sp. BM2 TaxID=3400421 RepID=UPI003B0136C3
MVYRLITAKSPMIIYLFVGIIFLVINNGESGVLAFLSILLIIFSFIGFNTKTEFIISQEELNYKIMIHGFKAFHKKLFSADIDKVLFKRYGWATKGATIKLNKGLNLRIVQFTPKDVMLQLETFAINNNVSISKSKDYLLLERREKY